MDLILKTANYIYTMYDVKDWDIKIEELSRFIGFITDKKSSYIAAVLRAAVYEINSN